jgi:hypothetical protein
MDRRQRGLDAAVEDRSPEIEVAALEVVEHLGRHETRQTEQQKDTDQPGSGKRRIPVILE